MPPEVISIRPARHLKPAHLQFQPKFTISPRISCRVWRSCASPCRNTHNDRFWNPQMLEYETIGGVRFRDRAESRQGVFAIGRDWHGHRCTFPNLVMRHCGWWGQPHAYFAPLGASKRYEMSCLVDQQIRGCFSRVSSVLEMNLTRSSGKFLGFLVSYVISWCVSESLKCRGFARLIMTYAATSIRILHGWWDHWDGNFKLPVKGKVSISRHILGPGLNIKISQ
jgi:hypothetical protein